MVRCVKFTEQKVRKGKTLLWVLEGRGVKKCGLIDVLVFF